MLLVIFGLFTSPCPAVNNPKMTRRTRFAVDNYSTYREYPGARGTDTD